MPTAKRLRDFALYLVISTTFIFVAIGGAILSGKSGPSFLKWVEFAGFTAVLFWILDSGKLDPSKATIFLDAHVARSLDSCGRRYIRPNQP
jgi:hypothetical protein